MRRSRIQWLLAEHLRQLSAYRQSCPSCLDRAEQLVRGEPCSVLHPTKLGADRRMLRDRVEVQGLPSPLTRRDHRAIGRSIDIASAEGNGSPNDAQYPSSNPRRVKF